MDTTIFLAQLWGPVMIAVSIGFFSNRSYYTKLYQDIGKDAFAGVLFGMVAMATGLAQVLSHNVWDTFAQGFISFLGWGLLLKGAMYAAAPAFADRMGEKWSRLSLGTVVGSILLVAGAYLTWFAYFA